MELMQRWQLKQSAKEQLRGKWGNMALKSFLVMVLPSAILWAIFTVFSACFAVNTVMPRAKFELGMFDLHGIGLNGLVTVGMVLNVLIYICVIIAAIALDFGFSDACIKLRSGEVTGAGAVFGKFQMLPRILMFCLLLAVIALPYIVVEILATTFPGIAIECLSFVLMIVYIYIILRLSMGMFILLENPYTPAWTALKQSWYIMKGQCFRFFVLNLSFLGWAFLATLSLGIGMFWLQPYMNMTTVNFYYNLKEVCLQQSEQ